MFKRNIINHIFTSASWFLQTSTEFLVLQNTFCRLSSNRQFDFYSCRFLYRNTLTLMFKPKSVVRAGR